MDEAEAAQANYYNRTAEDYETAHVIPGDEHYIALEYINGICSTIGAESLVDVGAGTGRAVAFLRNRRPTMQVHGVEPVEALRAQAIELGIEGLRSGSGEDLPYPDQSIDIVIATAVMHHVADPSKIIAEMTRVAKKAVVISDANRFGQGSIAASLIKLGLLGSRLWRPFMYARTRGVGHMYSEGDGVFYSYSLYDSVDQISLWATRTFLIPTLGDKPRRYSGSLFTSQAGILVGVREPCFPSWARPDADQNPEF